MSGKDFQPPSPPPSTPTGDVAKVLRTVYDDTLKEQIPPEMLDLLGKLD